MGLDVLVVDDEPVIATILARYLSREGHNVRTAHDRGTAIAELDERPCDVMFCDVQLGDSSGVDLVRELRARHADMQVVFVTGDASFELSDSNLGSCDVMTKPVRPQQIKDVVAKLEG